MNTNRLELHTVKIRILQINLENYFPYGVLGSATTDSDF